MKHTPSHRMKSGLNRRLASALRRRRVPVNLAKPVLSITFDDFPKSAVDGAIEILAKCNAKATYYAAGGLMAGHTDQGPAYDADDIKALISCGHEIGCHTFSHIDCTRATTADIQADFKRNADLFRTMGIKSLNSFAYPFGNVCLNSKSVAGSTFTSARGVRGTYVKDKVDLNLLPAMGLEASRDPRKIDNAMKAAARDNGWLILYTHDVCEQPTQWGTTPERLQQVLTMAIDQGYEIVPVGPMVDRLLRAMPNDDA